MRKAISPAERGRTMPIPARPRERAAPPRPGGPESPPRSGHSRPGHSRPAHSRPAGIALLAAGLLLAGCDGMPSLPGLNFGGGGAAAPEAPVTPTDPVAAFAASATPGQQGAVVLENGARVPVRLQRAYAAASGRECREVLVGGLNGESRLVCRLGGTWVAARPLMLGRSARS
ncbi:hypothetical protein M0638_09390 [Roseomonas sp. NAR14]|uniref:Common-antigen outer membrane protein n=1 Tax=Roseomonas acroporae TaxID=2937791 RepID=A0A9X1Y5H1_9PROT|nr:DVU3141 family protein [Roseomonas acroporae]MCK8784594.1 hypothetical protein [Roseomonas acroporae]